MVAPTSSHPSYRLSTAEPVTTKVQFLSSFNLSLFSGGYRQEAMEDDEDEAQNDEREAGRACYLFDVVHYSTQRFRITYEERVPDKMQRTKRYDYSPPGPSPLRKTHIHRRGRGGKGNGMARRARYLAKQARREARREAEHVAQPPPETQITPLPDLMDTMTVQKDETKAVEKAVLLRKTRKHVRSAAARVKRNSKSRFRARRARLLKSEELLSNGP